MNALLSLLVWVFSRWVGVIQQVPKKKDGLLYPWLTIRWPTNPWYATDRGTIPVETYKDWAERYAWYLEGSENERGFGILVLQNYVIEIDLGQWITINYINS